MSDARASSPPSRARLGNALALLGVLACGFALLPLHDDAWWPAPPGLRDWTWAGAITLLYLAGSAWLLLRARTIAALPVTVDAGPLPWLVVHASQTGYAIELARHTAASLAGAGAHVVTLPLSDVDGALLARTERALFVASTTGEGDPPDPALAFVRDVMAAGTALDGLQYAVLALGDRSYAHYCGFGHQLDQWLRGNGATALFDLTEVDNGDPGALRHWQHHIALAAGVPDLPDWTSPQYGRWVLQARRLLNPGGVGGPAFHLALQPADGDMPAWTAGDIAEVGPRNAAAAVDALLAAHALDGDTPVVFQGTDTSLRDALSRAQLHALADPAPADARALAAALPPLPHREYSIASLPEDGQLELLVRRMARADGSPGLGSGWLCEGAPIGSAIDLRIRANPNFHPPRDARPMILVGNGTGIAGLRALLKARIASGATRHWLLFGERQRAHDAFFIDELEHWRRDGRLERLDLVFSRDGGAQRYVQDALRDAAPTLREWIADGACLYVCGSLEGMAPGVDAVLREALGDDAVARLRDEGRYRRDVY
ncbi:MAG: flavodoxin domain-containing protein [Luteimonas sp.]|nr:flavodoxin domain-containing protein [Luteimonas sp.]